MRNRAAHQQVPCPQSPIWRHFSRFGTPAFCAKPVDLTTLSASPFSALAFRDVREEAVQSIQRYFTEQLDERIGNIQAGALLGFFLEEIGPTVYNLAVQEAQERL